MDKYKQVFGNTTAFNSARVRTNDIYIENQNDKYDSKGNKTKAQARKDNIRQKEAIKEENYESMSSQISAIKYEDSLEH